MSRSYRVIIRQPSTYGQCRIFIMLLRVYIDDSSDEKKERVAVAGAFLGSFKQWGVFVQRWRKRLKKDILAYFRTIECRNLRGEFSRFMDRSNYPPPKGREAAQAIRDDLDAIIHECRVVGIAACVPVRLYRHIRNETKFGVEVMPADPFDYAIQELFLMCAQEVQQHRKGDAVAFICDDGPSSARVAEIYTQFKQINPNAAKAMAALVHADDKKFPQLQAADLMAHLAKERFAGWLVDRSTKVADETLAARLKKVSVYRIGIPERERLLEFVRHEILTRGFI
jgi:hypothetical protein